MPVYTTLMWTSFAGMSKTLGSRLDCSIGFDVNIGTGTMYMMVRMVLVRKWLRSAEPQPNRIHRARRLGGRGYMMEDEGFQ